MRGSSDIPQPIPYQGSKRQLAPEILRYFPERIDRLVEPFAGSAAISIAVASRKRAKTFWLNDAHKPLIDLWVDIVDHPTRLADEYESLWQGQLGNERNFFDQVRSRFNKTHATSDFLYLLALLRCGNVSQLLRSFSEDVPKLPNTSDLKKCQRTPTPFFLNSSSQCFEPWSITPSETRKHNRTIGRTQVGERCDLPMVRASRGLGNP